VPRPPWLGKYISDFGIAMRPYLNGLLTGLFLQLSIGPVFFFIFGITLESNYLNSLSAILAVTIVDYLYISLSIFGVGKLLEKPKVNIVLGIIGSLVLIVFGIITLVNSFRTINIGFTDNTSNWNIYNSFSIVFFLTLSSPLTIIFWSSVFVSKAIENNYIKNQLIFFGIGAGFSTFVFLSLTMLIISLIKTNIPLFIIKTLNIFVGITMIFYGVIRFIKVVKPKNASNQ
jgi:threonine/homoserine/homoserine lactone efflux protein